MTVPMMKKPTDCVYFLPKILNSVNAPTIKFDGSAIEFIIIFSIILFIPPYLINFQVIVTFLSFYYQSSTALVEVFSGPFIWAIVIAS